MIAMCCRLPSTTMSATITSADANPSPSAAHARSSNQPGATRNRSAVRLPGYAGASADACHRGVAVLVVVCERAVQTKFRRERGLGGVAVPGVFEAAGDADDCAVGRRRIAEAAERLHLGFEHVAGLHPS